MVSAGVVGAGGGECPGGFDGDDEAFGFVGEDVVEAVAVDGAHTGCRVGLRIIHGVYDGSRCGVQVLAVVDGGGCKVPVIQGVEGRGRFARSTVQVWVSMVMRMPWSI